jgi:hypothetical protein
MNLKKNLEIMRENSIHNKCSKLTNEKSKQLRTQTKTFEKQ